MTNTTNYLADLPATAFSPYDGDGFEFGLSVTQAEFTGMLLPVLTTFIALDVSIDFHFTSAAMRESSFCHLRVRVTNDEFQADEVARALNRVLSEINS